MNLIMIPATAFPSLQQIAIKQTSSRTYSFEIYLKLSEFIQHVLRMRFLAHTLLAKKDLTENISNLINNLKNSRDDKDFDHHAIVYCLYLLGAYKEASQFI
jgi:hypothetical protein